MGVYLLENRVLSGSKLADWFQCRGQEAAEGGWMSHRGKQVLSDQLEGWQEGCGLMRMEDL